MVLYGLKACDSCRKALKTLRSAGFTPEFVDVRSDGVPGPVFERFYTTFGDALLNSRSTTWRGLSEDERARPVLELIAAHPALMKRPVIEDGARLTLGWGKDVAADWLAAKPGTSF